MRPAAALLLAATGFLSVEPASAGTTWYVDSDGTPPGTGTPADPYASIQYAIDRPTTVAGDTVLVLPGTYVENVDMGAKPILVASAAGPLETVLVPLDTGENVLRMTKGFGIAAFEGFTITGGVVTAIHIEGGALRRCIVRDNTGIGVFGELGASVDRCTIVGNGTGIYASVFSCCCDDFFVRSSIVWANGEDSSQGPGRATVSFSAGLAGVPAAWCQSSNVQADPALWDLAGGDLHLFPGSPCIGAGQGGVDIGALPYDPSYAPGTSTSCAGDALACPCGNGGDGGGCDNSQATGGVAIAIQHFAPDGAGGGTAQIAGSGYPPSAQPSVTLIRSPGLESPPVVFGDGLRCIATAGLVRVNATLASGGASVNAISHGAGAGTFHYQLWYRSSPASFCDPAAAYNLSDALTVFWP